HECSGLALCDFLTGRLIANNSLSICPRSCSMPIQAVDHELRPIAGQDFLFGGLFLAAVYPFFFLRSFCRQFLILRRDDGRLISFVRAIDTVDNALGAIARQYFFRGWRL